MYFYSLVKLKFYGRTRSKFIYFMLFYKHNRMFSDVFKMAPQARLPF